jgi:RecA/RadA recombinase
MSKKWMEKLAKLDGAVDRKYNPFNNVIRTPSPSVNFIFGNTHGLPLGYSMVLFGPPKGGKSVLANALIGQLHRDDPTAIAIKFNTERRETVQLTNRMMEVYGIDPDRYIAFETNSAAGVFDRIANEIRAMCQEGAPIKLIVIDSITSIVGRRASNADSIETQQIGDDAATLQSGLKMILGTLREYRIACVLITQIRAEMDRLEQMRGNTTKMAGAFALKHFAEYFVYVEPNQSKEGKTDLSGKEFVDETKTDLMDKGERMAHKIRVVMKNSSIGPKGRAGEFTLDYYNGIVNTHEEAFLLGTRRGIIERPNNRTYIVSGWPEAGRELKFGSKDDCLLGLKNNPDLANEIIRRVRAADITAMENGIPQSVLNMTNVESESEPSTEAPELED